MSTLTQLKRRLKRHGITQDRVATEAKVTRTMVNHVLNGRAKSRFVTAAINRLLADRERVA